MWVEDADSFKTDKPDEIRDFITSIKKNNQESSEDNCCPIERNKPNPNGRNESISTDDLGWTGVGLGVIEESTELMRSSQTIVIPIYNETGNVIAGWKVISKQTGHVLKYVKAGVSGLGYSTAGITVIIDANDLANGDLSVSRFSYHTIGTVAAAATAFYLSAGIGALVGGTFILGEYAYDGWAEKIQPQINRGYTDFRNALKKGRVPFR